MIELLKIAAKALATYGKSAVKGLMSAGKTFLKSGKNFSQLIKGNKKGLIKNALKNKNAELTGSADDDNTPSLPKIVKHTIKNKLKDSVNFKKVSERMADKFNNIMSQSFGSDYRAIHEKHRLMNELRDKGVPLSKVLEMDQQNLLTRENLSRYYKDLKKNSTKNEDARNNKLLKDFNSKLVKSYKNQSIEPLKSPDRVKLNEYDNNVNEINSKYLKDVKKLSEKYSIYELENKFDNKKLTRDFKNKNKDLEINFKEDLNNLKIDKKNKIANARDEKEKQEIEEDFSIRELILNKKYENNKARLEEKYNEDLNKKTKDFNELKAEYEKKKLIEIEKLKGQKQKDLQREQEKLNSDETTSKVAEMLDDMHQKLSSKIIENNELSIEERENGLRNLAEFINNISKEDHNKLNEKLSNLENYLDSNFENLLDDNASIKEFTTNICKNLEEKGTENYNFLNDSLKNIFDANAESVIKEAENKKITDDAMMGAIKDINDKFDKDKEEDEKNQREQEEEKLKLNENQKLANAGIINVLKSQSTLGEMVLNNKKKPSEIVEIFNAAAKDAVKSMGKEIGFWGTSLAITLKKLPEAICSGLNALLEPLNKIEIPNFMKPLGKGLFNLFGNVGKYETPEWIESAKDWKVIGGVFKGVDWLAEKIMNIPYGLGQVGANLMEGDDKIPLGKTIADGLTLVPRKVGSMLSKGLLTVMGLPSDMLDESEREGGGGFGNPNFKTSAVSVSKGDNLSKVTEENLKLNLKAEDGTPKLESPITQGAIEKIDEIKTSDDNNKINKITENLIDAQNEKTELESEVKENNNFINNEEESSNKENEVKEGKSYKVEKVNPSRKGNTKKNKKDQEYIKKNCEVRGLNYDYFAGMSSEEFESEYERLSKEDKNNKEGWISYDYLKKKNEEDAIEELNKLDSSKIDRITQICNDLGWDSEVYIEKLKRKEEILEKSKEERKLALIERDQIRIKEECAKNKVDYEQFKGLTYTEFKEKFNKMKSEERNISINTRRNEYDQKMEKIYSEVQEKIKVDCEKLGLDYSKYSDKKYSNISDYYIDALEDRKAVLDKMTDEEIDEVFNNNSNMKIKEYVTEVVNEESSDKINKATEIVNNAEVDSDEYLKEESMDTKKETVERIIEKEPTVIVQPVSYTYEREVHKSGVNANFNYGNGN